jgi:hypothetical protein
MISRSSDHDSTSIRPSVLDACLQLGVLDNNSPIAHWMFSEPASSGTSEEGGGHLKRHGSRFHERISPSPARRLEDVAAPVSHEPRNPFSVVRFKSGSKGGSKPNPESANDVRTTRRETGFLSIRSFFSRASLWRSSNNDGNTNAHQGGRASTNSRSLFQSKHAFERLDTPSPSVRNISSPMPGTPFPATASYELSPLATPFPRDLHDDGDNDDDDWERVDIRPQSALLALQYEHGSLSPRRLKKKRPGVPVEQSPTTENVTPRRRHRSFSFSLPRPNMLKSRKSFPPPLSSSVAPPSDNQSHRPGLRTRSTSTSVPSSPSVFVTPYTTPRATSPISASFESPHTPQLAHRPSMGYHNQFFVRDSSQTISPKLTPPLPPSPPRGRRVSLPQSESRTRHLTPPL